MAFLLLFFFTLPGYHWESFPTMHVWYLRQESNHSEVALCWTQPQKEGVLGKLTGGRDNPTKYPNLQACESDLEFQIKAQ